MANYLPSPYYGRPDLVTPMNNLARALLGSAQDDSAIARAEANRALSERYGVEQRKIAQEAEIKRLEAEALRNQQRRRAALASSPTVQGSLASALGIQPMSDGELPPITQDYLEEYFNRGGNIENFANASRRMQGTGLMMDPRATEDTLRRAGALLGLEPDKNTAYSYSTANDILEGDRQVIRDRDTARDATSRYGIEVRDKTQRRGQDIGSRDRRRGQDISSEDRRRGQDMASEDRQRGQDMRGTGSKGGGKAPPMFTGKLRSDAEKILNQYMNGEQLDMDLRADVLAEASRNYQESRNLETAVQDAIDTMLGDDNAQRVEDKSIWPWSEPKVSYKKRKDAPKRDAAPANKASTAPDMNKANQIKADLKAGKISREDAIKQLQQLGFD